MEGENSNQNTAAFFEQLKIQPLQPAGRITDESIARTQERINTTINPVNAPTTTPVPVNANVPVNTNSPAVTPVAVSSATVTNRLVDRTTYSAEIRTAMQTRSQREAFINQNRRIPITTTTPGPGGSVTFASTIPASFVSRNPATGVAQLNGNLTTVANTSNVANFNLRNTLLTQTSNGNFLLTQSFVPKERENRFTQRYYIQGDYGDRFNNRGTGAMLTLRFSGGRTSIDVGGFHNNVSAGVTLTRDTSTPAPVVRPLTAVDIDQSVRLNPTNAETNSPINTTTPTVERPITPPIR
jgi:hypothetical protein